MNSPWTLDPQSKWEVALTELVLPKTFRSYPGGINPLEVEFFLGDNPLQSFRLDPVNFYHSPNDIVECLNDEMEEADDIEFIQDESDRLCDYFKFYYDPRTLRVCMRIENRPPVEVTVQFSDGLTELFNIQEDEFIITSSANPNQFERVVFSEMFNFNLFDVDYIHVLLQETNMSFINNKMIPWLYSCPLNSTDIVSHSHTHITVKPKSLCYVPLNFNNSMRNKLHIAVVDKSLDVLRPLNSVFKHNDTIFHLHFRNIIPGR